LVHLVLHVLTVVGNRDPWLKLSNCQITRISCYRSNKILYVRITCVTRAIIRALQKTFFSEIFVFASFGNSRFSNFGNISVISVLSEHFQTRKNRENRKNRDFSQKNHEKLQKFVFASFRNSPAFY